MSEETVDEFMSVDAGEFVSSWEEDSEEEKFSKGFSPRQIGSIAKYIEPVNGATTIDVIADMFDNDRSLAAVPVEEYDRVVGVLDRRTVDDATSTALKRFLSKPVSEYMTRVDTVLHVRDYIEKALGKISEISRKYGIVYFPVYNNRRNFFGLVSLDEFLARTAEIRERDLQKASAIQKGMFPEENYLKKNFKFSIATYNRMANSLGGDCYEAIPFSDYDGIICCLDVSGKNVAASLLTVAALSYFKMLKASRNRPDDPARILADFDAYLEGVVPVGNFITGVVVYVDVRRRLFKVFNCGHTTTFLVYRHPGVAARPKVARIEPKLAPFGMGQVKKALEASAAVTDVRQKPYSVLAAKKGIHLELYSDGFTDMLNEDGFRFEEDNAVNFFTELYMKRPEEVHAAIEEQVNSYTGNAMLPDDITVIDIRFDSVLFL